MTHPLHPIIVDAAEPVACPRCNHRFALSEGISRQAIDRHAEAYERGLAERRRALEAELALEAKRRAEAAFESRIQDMRQSLAERERDLSKFRNEELALRAQLRALEDAKQ